MGALNARRILVAGGYGAVGAPLSEALVRQGADVIVAGRSLARAQHLAATIGAQARMLDVGDPTTWSDALAGVDLVVMCIDQADTRLVRYLFDRDIHYADLTASDALFRAIEALPPPRRSSALLSVGLAPGLTNLMATEALARLEAPGSVEIGLMVGLDDTHGPAGIEWMAERIFDPGQPRRARQLDFGAPWGHRTAHRVDFSDQHALTRRFPRSTFTTSVAFESRLATASLFTIAAAFAENRFVRRLVQWSFSRLQFGTSDIALAVEARANGRKVWGRFAANGESLTTARIAAVMIAQFWSTMAPPGIHHSHDALHIGSLLATLERTGIGRIEWCGRGRRF